MPIVGLTVSETGTVMQRLAVTTKVAIGEVVKTEKGARPAKLDHFVFLRKSGTHVGRHLRVHAVEVEIVLVPEPAGLVRGGANLRLVIEHRLRDPVVADEPDLVEHLRDAGHHLARRSDVCVRLLDERELLRQFVTCSCPVAISVSV